MNYREIQYGAALNTVLILLFIAVSFLFVFQLGDRPIDNITYSVMVLVLVIVFLMFFKLAVIVDNDYIIISFGIGLIKKTIKLTEIAAIKKVKNKWYYGWGIRFIGKGMLYNINGLDAVELSFKNKSSIIRIGTKSDSRLFNAIEQRIFS